MKAARMLGSFVENKIQEQSITSERLETILHMDEQQIMMFYEGRLFLSFPQIKALSDELGLSINALLQGNERQYNESVIHCMNDFENNDKREKILDMIDDYLDIYDAVQ